MKKITLKIVTTVEVDARKWAEHCAVELVDVEEHATMICQRMLDNYLTDIDCKPIGDYVIQAESDGRLLTRSGGWIAKGEKDDWLWVTTNPCEAYDRQLELVRYGVPCCAIEFEDVKEAV